MIKISAAALLALGLLTSHAYAQPELQSDQDRTLYALGVAIGANIQDFSLTPDEVAIVAMGIQDAALGSEYRVDMQVYGPRIQEFANERMASAASTERAASATFLEEMAAEPGAELMASGLVYIPMTAGTGASPAATDTVRVHYHGTLRDGTVFDSSVQRGEPASFVLNSVIPCWTEGVQLMTVGAKSKLVCPPDLAYGDRATGQIPAGSALVFEVELLGIE
jgi:FKBP-type peptidyl-prolyl cis-trans isomerase FkpA